MISKKEVEHIAKLARLGVSQKEVNKFQKELSKILDYFKKLEEMDISDVEPTSHSVLLENIKREDKADPQEIETKKDLLEAVPKEKEGYIKVKSIL
ncbi:MAG: asparaginyl/glutamyl-tRNA amidotransferase subunit C [Candidatus Nealsonbacteria bacterium RBG_13_36_15]|uniref:Aspartyl/glutamyl-tRNA(Asn/Gln) amidotransferase subunit C n=1 Tax=Candidatus Nealsonbacteria bacterium RBG_13_36_15 TaxID=1801660 RepID=A0A1G2DV59_9BACT|nr:MAG: asparaginyl/glutamyl-tRNA amidotransferase subunit C [Candidatus Nealsonbacteria bacterium RBG_13_36_15]